MFTKVEALVGKLATLFLVINLGQATVVMDCSLNSQKDTYAGAWWSGIVLEPLKPFTACIRLQFSKLKLHNVVLHINDTFSAFRPAIQMSVYVDKLKVAVAHEYKFALLEEWLQPNRWYHMCVANDPSMSDGLTISLNAKTIATHPLKLRAESLGTFASIGFFDPNFYPGLSFVGNLTQFNVWSRILNSNEIRDLFDCRMDLEGDIISWSRKFETMNTIQFDIPLENLCNLNVQAHTKLLSASDYFESAFVCEGIGGELITPSNLSYGQELISWAKSSHPDCKIYWLGIWDNAVEGQWSYHKTNILADNLPWAPDEPNGLHFENCGGLDFEGIIDDSCSTERCPFCAIPPATPWTLYGSCEAKTHDMNFMLEINHNNSWLFKGYGDYVIFKEKNEWVWKNKKHNETIAILESSYYNYPIGRQTWKVIYPICHQTEGLRTLLLSTCSISEFSCNDATCVSLEERCDLKYDCADNSDELNCTLFRLPEDYKSNVAPRGQGSVKGSSLPVEITVTLETIRIDTNKMILEVSYNLSFSWLENRAIYVNLKRDSTLNVIDPLNNELWSPSVAFVNTEDDAGTIVDGQTSCFVIYGKSSHLNDPTVPEKVTLFEGYQNLLVSYRKYQTSFTCDFDLSSYPFDAQLCNLDFRLRYGTVEALHFDKEKSSALYKGNKFLMEYMIGNITLSFYEFGGFSGMRVLVPLFRLHGYAYINIYLPTLTMLIIGYLTLVFQIKIFEVRIMTSLTALLVLATLFTQVAAALPKTSYFKLVDVWFLFCIFFCFFVIVIHIIIDAIDKSSSSTSLGYSDTKVETFKGSSKSFVTNQTYLKSIRNSATDKYLSFVRSSRNAQRAGVVVMFVVFSLFNLSYWITIYKEVNNQLRNA